jgi:hypothetical protein
LTTTGSWEVQALVKLQLVPNQLLEQLHVPEYGLVNPNAEVPPHAAGVEAIHVAVPETAPFLVQVGYDQEEHVPLTGLAAVHDPIVLQEPGVDPSQVLEEEPVQEHIFPQDCVVTGAPPH